MKIWLQVIVSVGILCVSAAAVSYTWTVARDFILEERIREFCATRYPLPPDDVRNEICVKLTLSGSWHVPH